MYTRQTPFATVAQDNDRAKILQQLIRSGQRRHRVRTLVFVLTTSAAMACSGHAQDAPSPHVPFDDDVLANRVDASIARAEDWLLACETSPGVLKPLERADASPVLLYSMVIWALSENARSEELREFVTRCLQTLSGYRQEDGGVYKPAAGQARYESEAALAALCALPEGIKSAKVARLIRSLEAFVAPRRQEYVDEKLIRNRHLDELSARKSLGSSSLNAVEFLRRVEIPQEDPVADEHAPSVFSPNLSRRTIMVDRLIRANADPTVLRLPEGVYFQLLESTIHHGAPSRRFQFLVMSRLLLSESGIDSSFATIMLPRAARELVETQRADGSWDAERPSLYDEPLLETCFALIVLRTYQKHRGPFPRLNR